MCSAPNVYMFVYILIATHMVPLTLLYCLPNLIYIAPREMKWPLVSYTFLVKLKTRMVI